MKTIEITSQKLKDYENSTHFVSNINNTSDNILVIDECGKEDKAKTDALKRLIENNIEREELLKTLLK